MYKDPKRQSNAMKKVNQTQRDKWKAAAERLGFDTVGQLCKFINGLSDEDAAELVKWIDSKRVK